MKAYETNKHSHGSSLPTRVNLPEHLSACRTFYTWQVGLAGVLLGGWFFWLFHDAIGALTWLVFLWMLFVTIACAFKTLLVTLSIVARKRMISITPKDLVTFDRRVLPLYTVLVPLYKEAKILPHLIDALLALDYPTDKLDIILLLEADDEETIAAVTKNPLPLHFRALIVPPGYPKTKPRACNVGLTHARGEFLVIYDAEDRPDADQLKKALAAFQQSDERVICVQSQLNYYNPRQNLLTRLFTLEYSFWFDLLLPGLSMIGAPIPLGGTSNHFQASALKAIGGWDAFNVTEDCDLGIRLAVAGYQTVIMNSTTWEEANSQIDNWIRQRSRWIKGYLQTYLVHMRNPLRLLRNLGWWNFLSFQLIVGGTPGVLLLTPALWLFVLICVLARMDPFEQVFLGYLPGQVNALGLFLTIFGVFSFWYLGIRGAIVRGNNDLIKYVLLNPLYYLMQGLAAWKGCLQLLTRPHFWEKTTHGLFPSMSSGTDRCKIIHRWSEYPTGFQSYDSGLQPDSI